jgi:hypothetical protein
MGLLRRVSNFIFNFRGDGVYLHFQMSAIQWTRVAPTDGSLCFETVGG